MVHIPFTTISRAHKVKDRTKSVQKEVKHIKYIVRLRRVLSYTLLATLVKVIGANGMLSRNFPNSLMSRLILILKIGDSIKIWGKMDMRS